VYLHFVSKTIAFCSSSLFYLSFLAILFFSYGTAQAQDKKHSESKIKTALIYNILHFIEWSSQDLTICVYEPNKDYESSFKAIPSSTKSGTRLDIKFLHSNGGLLLENNCHVAFITSDTDIQNTLEILSDAKSNHILTIGESKQFISQGGMINFIQRDVNIKFEVNATAFKQANLKISSQVLRIADRVYTDNNYE
jgi:uncharacterized protein DUF4154